MCFWRVLKLALRRRSQEIVKIEISAPETRINIAQRYDNIWK